MEVWAIKALWIKILDMNKHLSKGKKGKSSRLLLSQRFALTNCYLCPWSHRSQALVITWGCLIYLLFAPLLITFNGDCRTLERTLSSAQALYAIPWLTPCFRNSLLWPLPLLSTSSLLKRALWTMLAVHACCVWVLMPGMYHTQLHFPLFTDWN